MVPTVKAHWGTHHLPQIPSQALPHSGDALADLSRLSCWEWAESCAFPLCPLLSCCVWGSS